VLPDYRTVHAGFLLSDRLRERAKETREARAAKREKRRRLRLAAAQRDGGSSTADTDDSDIETWDSDGDDPMDDDPNSADGAAESAPAASPGAGAGAGVGDTKKGQRKSCEGQQMLPLNHERIRVPELLFSPTDVGMRQTGVVGAIVQSVLASPLAMRGSLLNSTLIVGGSTLFPNFRRRLLRDLRTCCPTEFPVQVHVPDDAVLAAWRGGSSLAAQAQFEQTLVVTKAEYEEHGHEICRNKFHSVSFSVLRE
jgi:actin-related protein 6